MILRHSNSKGFTFLEILVALSILSALLVLSTTNVNSEKFTVETISGGLLSGFSDISLSLTNYQSDKNAMPTGLDDTSFASWYIYPPNAPNGFDQSYGVNGFRLAHQTGQPSPQNGWFVCAKATVSGPTDVKWQAITQTAQNLSSGKFFYNTSCPALSNMAAPGGTSTVYVTNWITNE